MASNAQAYAGVDVRTQGTVARFVDPAGPYFVLEDGQDHRVELLPATGLSRMVGQDVSVTGTFEMRPGVGRVIDIVGVEGSRGFTPAPPT